MRFRAAPCLLALILLAGSASAQVTGRGTEFWAAWPRTHLSLEASAELVVMVELETEVAVDGAFSFPPTSVSPGTPLRIPLPDTLRISADQTVVPRGFRVFATDGLSEIHALFRVPRQAEASDDIARLLPSSELGLEYRVAAYPASQPNEPSFFLIVATEDGTRATIDNPCSAGTLVVDLDAGDAYQVFCTWMDAPADVTGASVVVDKPAVVLAGAASAWVPLNYLAGDVVFEAAVPVSSWGTEFFVGPLPKGPGAEPLAHDVLRIVPSAIGIGSWEDSSGGGGPLAFIAPGRPVELRVTEPMRLLTGVSATVQILAPGVEMSDLGDPFLSDVPPVRDYGLAHRVYVPPAYAEGSYLSITAPTAALADVRVSGVSVTDWVALPGGVYSHALEPLGFRGPELELSGSAPMGAIVHGYNDRYAPNPALGRVPGSYGYPASVARPQCLLFPRAGAPFTACVGLTIDLGLDGDTGTLGCDEVEYRWLADGVPIPGCELFLDDPSCQALFEGEALYALEARCVIDPSCTALSERVILDLPAPPVVLQPRDLEICAGERPTLSATTGFTLTSWTSSPLDPGVTPHESALNTLTVSPDATTTYTVTVTDVRGCTSTDEVTVVITPDPRPPPIGNTLRVAKRAAAPSQLELTWTDLAADVGDYELVAVACPTLGWCPESLPTPPRLDAAALVTGPVAIGVQAVVDANAGTRGALVFYKARATSPCSKHPGPTCNPWPAQGLPCTTEQSVDGNCADGIDNDDDGTLDCLPSLEDPDCDCGPESLADGNCADGIDNDGDGLSDCLGGSPEGSDCACAAERVAEGNCADGADNDGDGRVDCRPGIDEGFDCNCGPEDLGSGNCSDGIDNDGDGLLDCEPGREELDDCSC